VCGDTDSYRQTTKYLVQEFQALFKITTKSVSETEMVPLEPNLNLDFKNVFNDYCLYHDKKTHRLTR